jgi:hypothetical protein
MFSPFPAPVKLAWSLGSALLITYPALKVREIPLTRVSNKGG